MEWVRDGDGFFNSTQPVMCPLLGVAVVSKGRPSKRAGTDGGVANPSGSDVSFSMM
jgi:hypothetical protein